MQFIGFDLNPKSRRSSPRDLLYFTYRIENWPFSVRILAFSSLGYLTYLQLGSGILAWSDRVTCFKSNGFCYFFTL